MDLPPLRERIEDIPILIEHFILRFNRLQGKAITGIDPAALGDLMNWSWPGNIRELRNGIEKACCGKGRSVLACDIIGAHKGE